MSADIEKKPNLESVNIETDTNKKTENNKKIEENNDNNGENLLPERKVILIFISLMITMLLAALDQTIVATALPLMASELNGLSFLIFSNFFQGLNQLSLVITVYILCATAFGPLITKISDLYPRKTVYVLSVGIFVFGSIVCGIANNMWILILGRAIQGAGAGGIMVLAAVIVADIVTMRERGKYQGFLGGTFALASVIGPLIGGVITDLGPGSWRWLFWINLPLALLGVIFVIKYMPYFIVTDSNKGVKLDLYGAISLIFGSFCLLLALSWGGSGYCYNDVYNCTWDSTLILFLLFSSIPLFGIFIYAELIAEAPILKLRLLLNRDFLVPAAAGFFMGYGMMGCLSFMSLWFQVVDGRTATEAGVQTIPLMIGLIVSSITIGIIITKTGIYRPFPIIGMSLLSIALGLLSLLYPGYDIGLRTFYLILIGLGIGATMQVLIIAAQNAVDQVDISTATAIMTFLRTMGGAIGVAICGSILNNELVNQLGEEAVSSSEGEATSINKIRDLPPELRDFIINAFNESLNTVFLAGMPFTIVGVIILCFMRYIPLKTKISGANIKQDNAKSNNDATSNNV